MQLTQTIPLTNSADLSSFDGTIMGGDEGPQVRIITHVHGLHVEADSDGWPFAWFVRGVGTGAVPTTPPYVGVGWKKSIFTYDNLQRASTLWYHDHAIGVTRLNIIMGLAGFYLIRSDEEMSLPLPSGLYDVPIVIQDRSFHTDGSFEYGEPPVPAVRLFIPSGTRNSSRTRPL